MTTRAILFRSETVKIVDYVCTAKPDDRPFVEMHATNCLAFTSSGSYGYRTRGERHQLVPGSFLVGSPGDEYVCSHEHHLGGDRCLSLSFAPHVADELGGGGMARPIWQRGAVPPLAELQVLAQLTAAAARGHADIGADEAALALGARFVEISAGHPRPAQRTSRRDRQRATLAAMWMEANSDKAQSLDDVASRVGLSAYHFLRVFKQAIGVSPHQYLVRVRLSAAARMLANDRTQSVTSVALAVGFADLSNFVRTFRRAAGLTPSAFQRKAHANSKILQARERRELHSRAG